MRCAAIALSLLFCAGSTAHGAPADCPARALTPTPANLAKLLKDHADWLATKDTAVAPKGARANLSYHDLTSVSLTNSDLREAILIGAKLHGAMVGGARLELADLTCTRADNASFDGANLFQATLTNASLVGSKFVQAKLGGAKLNGADLASADFSNADMRRADLASATMRNTRLKDAHFADANLMNVVWQPLDLPEASTMGAVANLSTLRLDPDEPNPGAMASLVSALREANLENRAKEAAHAHERAATAFDLANGWRDGDIVALAWASLRMAVGRLTDYGLSLTRGLLVLLTANLVFAPAYYMWGFSPDAARKTGIVRIVPEKSLVSSSTGEKLTEAAEVKPLRPASREGRAFWALCFAAATTIRSGVGSVNLLEVLDRIFGWESLAAAGWLKRLANLQALISLALIAGLVYAYLL